MNTALMFTRVSLLLIVVVLFAGMWSGDGLEGRTAAQIQMARRASTPRFIADRPAARSPRAESLSLVSRRTPAAIPMPDGIAAGDYLVVDQNGLTQRVTVKAIPGATGNLVPVEQYTVRNKGDRWHFIRLATSVQEPLQQASAAALR